MKNKGDLMILFYCTQIRHAAGISSKTKGNEAGTEIKPYHQYQWNLLADLPNKKSLPPSGVGSTREASGLESWRIWIRKGSIPLIDL